MTAMLWGRADEQVLIDHLLQQARNGVSGVLVLRGEPGIGKSALLDYAASVATGMRVIRATGVESEAAMPFSGLHLLLRCALGRLPLLPVPQAAAVRGAFGLAPPAGDRFLIGLGTLSLLAEFAEEGPLLCLVDDAHWLDHASAEALLIAARRLEAEGVALVFATREPGLATPGLPEARLAGLDEEAAAGLLRQCDGELPPWLVRRVLDEAAGNPLALIELPKALRPEAHSELPLTDRLQEAFEGQVASLPPAARTLLVVAAAEGTGELHLVLAAADTLGVSLADLQAPRDSGLIRVEGRRLTFRHPLVRAAVYQGAPLEMRLAVHDALADALGGPQDADRRAWHRAAAATRADEAMAEELERSALRASERSGFAAAAAAYERAAELSVDPGARTRRLTLAAEATEYSGRFDQARALAEHAGGRHADHELTSRLIRVRACSDYGQGSLPSAHALLSTGVDHIAEEDPQDAAWLLLDASSLIWLDGDRDMAVRTAAQLASLRLPPGDEALPVYRLCRWFTSLALREPIKGLPPLPDVMAEARALSGTDRRGLLMVSCLGLAEQDSHTCDLAAAATARIREHGRVGLLPQALTYLASTQLALGRHADARAHAQEAARIAHETSQPQWVRQAGAQLAWLAAVEGDEAGCAGFPEAQALLDLGLGRAEQVLLDLESLVYGRARNQIPAMRCVPDLVEAALRGGRPARAAEPFARFVEWAQLLDQRWSDALVARCRALLEPAESHFVAALALHSASRPFELARTELLYGEWLRRARRRVDARPHLSAALEVFDRLGATPWAERARTELDATGWSAPRADSPDRFSVLTPQERQIVQLAAQGLANRDIAARLFLSPRTVGQHLYKAYPKLGVSSRAELAALVPQP